MGFPGGTVVKKPPANARDSGGACLIPGSRSTGEGKRNLLQYVEKSHGQRSLAGYSSWGLKKSDTAEHACVGDTKRRYSRK